MVSSIDRGTNHFCCFAPGLEIAFSFAVRKENGMLTEWGTSRNPIRMIKGSISGGLGLTRSYVISGKIIIRTVDKALILP